MCTCGVVGRGQRFVHSQDRYLYYVRSWEQVDQQLEFTIVKEWIMIRDLLMREFTGEEFNWGRGMVLNKLFS